MHKERLTIVISTYNRCSRLKANLDKLLSYSEKRIRFLVGNNASTDGTAAYLEALVSDRLRVIHGTENNGFENFWLLAFAVSTEYFLFLNDRDSMDEKNLTDICNLLDAIKPCEIISCERGFWKGGYLNPAAFTDPFFFSRHPGTLIYAAAYCKCYLSREQVLHYIQRQKQNLFNIYLDCTLLGNLRRGYAYKKYLISQPKDRDMMKQERKDYYGCSYITPEYRLHEFDDWVEELGKEHRRGIENIFLSMIKNALFTLTYEFYYSIQSEDFVARNNCRGYKKNDWYGNGKNYIRHVLNSEIVKELKIKNRVKRIYAQNIWRFFFGLGLNRLAEIKNGLFKKWRGFS